MTPATGRFLLDTNVIIALLEGDETVLAHLDAAAAMHHRMVLVTRDLHFREVEHLIVADWADG